VTDKQLAARYRKGSSIRDLATIEGCSPEWIRQRLIRSGVELRPRARANTLTRSEEATIKRAIRKAQGDLTLAAQLLGRHKTFLYDRVPWAREYAEPFRARRNGRRIRHDEFLAEHVPSRQ
jgi:hypothetical protein